MATTESTRRQPGTTKRSTAAKRAAGTRAQNRTQKTTRTQARRTTRTAQRSTQRTAATAERQATTQANQVQDLVERAALTYVGAALTARDRVVQGYDYLRKTYGDPDSVQRQLKKFERRGTTGRNRFERQLKRSRTRVERELRQRRNQVRREATAARRDVTRQLKPLQAQVDLVSAQVENAVQTGVTEAQKAVERVVTPASRPRNGDRWPSSRLLPARRSERRRHRAVLPAPHTSPADVVPLLPRPPGRLPPPRRSSMRCRARVSRVLSLWTCPRESRSPRH